MKKALLLVAAILAIALAGGLALTPVYGGQDKVTICHASGLAGTTKFETLNIAYPAVYGEAGHFYENGTPRAGHEEDYLGPCNEDASPSPDATPTSSPSSAPSPSPTVAPSVEPSPEPSPTPSTAPPSASPSPLPTPSASVTTSPLSRPSLPETDTETASPADEEFDPVLFFVVFFGTFFMVSYAMNAGRR